VLVGDVVDDKQLQISPLHLGADIPEPDIVFLAPER
jgi:hypothetical protein